MLSRLALLLLPLPAMAQVMIDETRLPAPWLDITADVTGDGVPDQLTTTPHSADHDIVTLTPGHTYQAIFVPVPANRTGEPGLAVTSGTTFDIRTGCFACGRTHSEILWRMAWREGRLVVAGYRETIVDRLGARTVTCDANLRTHRADILVDGARTSEVTGHGAQVAPWEIATTEQPELCAQMQQFLE